MRTSLRFDVVGTTRKELANTAKNTVATFLELDSIDSIDDVADMEMVASTDDSLAPLFQATVNVRIR
jgi:hypothetical protein